MQCRRVRSNFGTSHHETKAKDRSRIDRRDEDETGQGAKAGLALALAAAADDDVLDDVIQLLHDQRHGQNRLLLVDVLAKSSDPRSRKALMELSTDPILGPTVHTALKYHARKR